MGDNEEKGRIERERERKKNEKRVIDKIEGKRESEGQSKRETILRS